MRATAEPTWPHPRSPTLTRSGMATMVEHGQTLRWGLGGTLTHVGVGLGEGFPIPNTDHAFAPRSVPSFFWEIFATSAFGATRHNAADARSQSDRMILARSDRVSSKCCSRTSFSSARC